MSQGSLKRDYRMLVGRQEGPANELLRHPRDSLPFRVTLHLLNAHLSLVSKSLQAPTPANVTDSIFLLLLKAWHLVPWSSFLLTVLPVAFFFVSPLIQISLGLVPLTSVSSRKAALPTSGVAARSSKNPRVLGTQGEGTPFHKPITSARKYFQAPKG